MNQHPKSWEEWEKPLIELEEALHKLEELVERASGDDKTRLDAKIKDFRARRDTYINKKYTALSTWEEVLVARAKPRPYTLDYINTLFRGFVELQGDRRFGADNAIIGGPAEFQGTKVMVVGHQKGRNLTERQLRNFAMSKPEGYRKAIRLFELANRLSMPIVTFIDTPAADPGVESESRGISEAIADSMMAMFAVQVPIVSTVIGEGGSGGAIGIGIGNRIFMQEHAIYSVIPPEGCAAILWRDAAQGPLAAEALKLTSKNALELGLIDKIIPEPVGGAHRDLQEAATAIGSHIEKALKEMAKLSPTELKQSRYDKFRKMGIFNSTLF